MPAHPEHHRGVGGNCCTVVEVPHTVCGLGSDCKISCCGKSGSGCKSVVISARFLEHCYNKCECTRALFPSGNTFAISAIGCIRCEARFDIAQDAIDQFERGFGIDIGQCQCHCKHTGINNGCGGSALNPHTSLAVVTFKTNSHTVAQHCAFDDGFSALAPNVVAPVVTNGNRKANRANRGHQIRVPIAEGSECFTLGGGAFAIFFITRYAIKGGKSKHFFGRCGKIIGKRLCTARHCGNDGFGLESY